MDFSFSEEQEAVRDLARRIFADRIDPERQKQLESGPEWFDLDLWQELGRAGIPGIALPAEHGGSGLGLMEVWLVLEEQGRALAPVPLLPSLVLAGLPLSEFGTPEQKSSLLPGLASGERVLSAAFHEVGPSNPSQPRTSARPDGADGSDWRLEGEKVCVPAAHLAERILVPARTGEGTVGIFLLDPNASGVKLERQETSSREPQFRIELSGATVAADDVLGDPRAGGPLVEWTVERGILGLCAIQLGVAEEALRRTAEYTSSRKQFSRLIGAFQGVSLRAADAYIDVEAMRSAFWLAAWRVEAGLPAAAEVAAAKWWACRGGHRVVHTAQHLHGGIGADVDYPIHRYFLWSRQAELALGGASQQLARIGALLAAGGREESAS